MKIFLVFFLLPFFGAAQSAVCDMDHDHDKEDGFYLPVSQAAQMAAPAELPLKGERTIRINTTEGSWLSLDVHPDGSTIIFAMLGDIYQIPFAGGKAKQLTSGLAFDSQPRYSPDGKSILYISDADGAENAWIMNIATGIKKVMTKSRDEYYQSAEWTPDGKYIVVAKGTGTPKLNLLHVDGGAGSLLTPTPADLKAVEPAFGNNSKLVWFSRRKGMWDYNAQMPQYQLATLDLETGETETKTSRYGSAFAPTLSSDGQWLVYGTRLNTETGLVLQNIATGDEKWLAYPVQHDEQESLASMGVLPSMSFTPDNKQLVASYGGKIYRIAIDGTGAKEIPFQVDTEIKIGPELKFSYPIKDDKEINATQIREPVISPNGKMAVFTALGRIYLMNYPSGEPVRLSNLEVPEGQPAWSPDSKSVVFVTWNEREGAIYKAGIAGKSKPVKLTEQNGYYQEPVFTPGGSRIVFFEGMASSAITGTSNRGASKQSLSWIAANGGPVKKISKAIGSNPHFTKDSSRIYLFSPADGLISIGWNADGLDKKIHLKVTGHVTYTFGNTNGGSFTYFRRTATPSVILKSPVGDKALAQISNEVYIVTIPPAGAEPPVISLADHARSSFPSWRITDIGAEYPSWSADGNNVSWSLGKSLFNYNVAKMDTGTVASEIKVLVKAKNDIPEGEILLKGARIITMKGEEVIENGDILIRNNRIVSVGASGTVNAGKAQVIDVTGKTIVPGFIDLHTHMSAGRGILGSQPVSYAANLAYGVTTTRNPQPGTTDIMTYDDLVNTGAVIGPRIYSTGPGVAYWAYNLKDLDHARRVLRQYSEYFNTKTIKMYAVGNRQQRQWIIMAAKEQGLMPTTEGNLDMKLNFTEVLDGYPGHEHAYPMFPLYKDAVEFIAKSGIVFTSTFLLDYGGPCAENYFYERENVINDKKLAFFTPKDELDRKGRRRTSWFAEEEYVFPREAKILDDVQKAGGLPAVGAHGQLQGLGYHWELWATQSGGMSNIDALKTATINGAKGIGLAGDLGSLEVGKLADLLILDKNPLENIRNTNTIKYVMKNGRLYDASNLAEIAPQKKPAPKFDWVQQLPQAVPGVVSVK